MKLATSLFAGWDREIQFRQSEESLRKWAEGHGIHLSWQRFAAGKAGQFDGTSVSMNSTYRTEDRLYYAVHAIGSIVIWSCDPQLVQRLFDELRDAKQCKSTEPERFTKAIEKYRNFEVESSEYAVWILAQLGAASHIPSYTNFMRADLEAMTQFHETGKAPTWKDFFSQWNARVEAGGQVVIPFAAKPVGSFQAVKIETQAILQQQ